MMVVQPLVKIWSHKFAAVNDSRGLGVYTHPPSMTYA